MKRTQQWNWLWFGLLVTMILTLTACGGGGGDSDTVTPAAVAPALTVSKTTLQFTAPVAGGADPAAQSFTIANTGSPTTTLSWTATSNQPWLTLDQGDGAIVQGSDAAVVTASASITGLTAGTHNAIITVGATGLTAKTINVSLTIGPAPAAAQASVVVGGRAGSATQLSSLVAAARAASAQKSAAGDPIDQALAKAKVTLEVIKADGTSAKYFTMTDNNGTYSLEADITVGDLVTVTFEKEGFTTFSKTLDTTGIAANDKRQFVVNGKTAQTGVIVSTKSGDVFKAGGGTTPGFRFGLMRAGSGAQRAFASSNDVRRAATYDGSKPELDINIPTSWAPGATALTAKLAAFDPSKPADRAMFPGEFVGIGGGAPTAGAAASKASVDQAAYQLESVSFFSAEVAPNTGDQLVTPAVAAAAGATKAAVPGNALIYKYIPVDGCTAIKKYADRDSATNGVQVPLYTYKSSTGKWGYLGEGTLAVYNSGVYDVANVADATTSLTNLSCGTTDYYFAIETADWTTWWNLDYPILLEAPKTVTLCGTVVDAATNGNPVPGASVVADGYAKGANSYHYAYAGNDGKFELEVLTGVGKTLDKFDFAAYDYSTWPYPSSNDGGGTFPTPPTDPVTTGCNQIGNVVVPSLNNGRIEGTVLEELTATTTKPLVGQWVWVESADYSNYFYNWAQTDANGKFAMKAPLNQDLVVWVLGNSYPVKIDDLASGSEATDAGNKVTLKDIKQPNSPPQVSTWISPNPAKAGKSVTLSAWAWDPEGNEPLSYQWKIDGANLSTVAEFNWTQSTAGEHAVDVVVTDSKGKSTTISETLSVSPATNSLPVLYYTWATPAASCGGTPTFYAYAYDPDGDVLTYTWSVPGTNDGFGGYVPTTTPTGDVSLTVSDGAGGSVTQTVAVPTTTQLTLYYTDAWSATNEINQPVNLYAYAYEPGGAITYNWTITGPNGAVPPAFNMNDNSSGSFTPTVPGLYTIELTANGSCGSKTRTLTSNIAAPVFNLNLDSSLYNYEQAVAGKSLNIDVQSLNFPIGVTAGLLEDLTEPSAVINGGTMQPTWTPTVVGTHTMKVTIIYWGQSLSDTLEVTVDPTYVDVTVN